MVYVCRVQSAHGTCDFAFWTRRLLKGRRLVLWCTNLTLSERVFFCFWVFKPESELLWKGFFYYYWFASFGRCCADLWDVHVFCGDGSRSFAETTSAHTIYPQAKKHKISRQCNAIEDSHSHLRCPLFKEVGVTNSVGLRREPTNTDRSPGLLAVTRVFKTDGRGFAVPLYRHGITASPLLRHYLFTRVAASFSA